jgi:hypothetical protein
MGAPTDDEHAHVLRVVGPRRPARASRVGNRHEIHPPTEELRHLLNTATYPSFDQSAVSSVAGSPIDGEKSVQSAVAERNHLALVTSLVDARRGVPACRGSTRVGTAVVPDGAEQSSSRAMGHARTSGASYAHVGFSRSVATRANSAKSSAIPSGVLFRATARAAYSVTPAVVDAHALIGAQANWAAIVVGRLAGT